MSTIIKNSMKEMLLITREKLCKEDRVFVWNTHVAVPVGYPGTILSVDQEHLAAQVAFDRAWQLSVPLFTICKEKSYRFYPNGLVKRAWLAYRKLQKNGCLMPDFYLRLKAFLDAHGENIESVRYVFNPTYGTDPERRNGLIASGKSTDQEFFVFEVASGEWTFQHYK